MELWCTPTATRALNALLGPGRSAHDAQQVDAVLDELENGEIAPSWDESPTGIVGLPVPETVLWIYARFDPPDRVEILDVSTEPPT